MEQRVKEYLCQVYGLGMDDVEELYELGCQTVQDTRGRIEVALSRNDIHELTEASHMLKGALFNMGLVEQGEMARKLELAGEAERMEEAWIIFPLLCNALEGFCRS